MEILKIKDWIKKKKSHKNLMEIVNKNPDLKSLYDDLRYYPLIDAEAEILQFMKEKFAEGTLEL